MRKAYTIIELLGLVAIFALIFALSARPVWIMARQSPHIEQMYDLQQRVDLFLGQLERDVEAAERIEIMPASRWTGGQTLYLYGPAGWVGYRIQPGWALRMTQSAAGEDRSWTLPHVELEWQTHEIDGRAVGVEIRSRINRPLLGKQEMKFQQSRLFFAGLREASR